MKLKSILAMTIALSTMSVFAADVALEVTVDLPQSVLDLHTKACPDFLERETTENKAYREAFKLPKSEYAKEGATLYVVQCEMYAYNSLEKAYLVDAYETKIVSVAEVTTDGSIYATSDLMGAGFDSVSNTLTTFVKGRGLGDCGSTSTYGYSPYENKFFLQQARVKESCDGDYESEWPIVYKK